MTIRIDAIHIAAVKSLAVTSIERAHVGRNGIDGDRAFCLIDAADKLLTQREQPRLALVVPTYDAVSGHLEMRFPDGSVVSGVPTDTGDQVAPSVHGYRDQPGVVTGVRFAEALTAFIGAPVQLVRATGQAFDALPLSICSRASLVALATVAGEAVDDRRFRQNIWLSGARAHQEDEWLKHDVRIGQIGRAHV